MKHLLIVYHTQSGTCAGLAQALAAGAAEEQGVALAIRRAWDAATADLEAADGLLLVAAENSGTLAGAAKDFLDRTFYPAIDRGVVMPCALVLSAGNDGRGAQRQAERIFKGYPFVPATETLILRGETTAEHLAQCRELGQAFAAGLVMGIF